MKTYIVLVPVSDSLAYPRNACDMIENTKFNFKGGKPTASKVLDRVMLELGVEESHNIEVEPISDFMERVNDEMFNPDDYFMSYVNAE